MAPKVKAKKSAKRTVPKPKQPAQRAGRTSTSRLSSKNQLTVPVDILRRVGLEAGDEVEFVVNDAGFIQIQVMADAHPVLNLVGAFPGVFDEFDQEKERAAWD
jgi:bifunctional DNA-binding transcriptional regulator/antitoxin component of YhaV-PrlF toxin-antitoxin module